MRNLNVDRHEPSFHCNPQAGMWLPILRLHILHARCSFYTLVTTRSTSLHGTQTTAVRIVSVITVTLTFCKFTIRTSELNGVRCQHHTPTALSAGKTSLPIE